MSVTTDPRRFGGVGRLFGEEGARRLAGAHVAVVGLGGVGSWVVEALVRTSVGRITLIDGDDVALSNTNRQLPAFEGAYGRAKAEVLRERCLLINPDCRIEVKTVFVTPENAAQVIPSDCDWLVDCIDDLKGKAALHAAARGMGVRTVCAGGAGARIDPSRIEVSDLARVKGDPLLGKLRTFLRKEYGFPAGSADALRHSRGLQHGASQAARRRQSGGDRRRARQPDRLRLLRLRDGFRRPQAGGNRDQRYCGRSKHGRLNPPTMKGYASSRAGRRHGKTE